MRGREREHTAMQQCVASLTERIYFAAVIQFRFLVQHRTANELKFLSNNGIQIARTIIAGKLWQRGEVTCKRRYLIECVRWTEISADPFQSSMIIAR